MRNLLVILSIALMYFSNCEVIAQNNFNRGFYFSGVVGSYQSGKSESRNGLSTISFGAGFGVPVYKNIYFYNKIIFHSKSNFSAYGNSFTNHQVTGLQEIERVNASFSQIIYNGGLQYDIQFSEEIIAGFNGGLTYSILSHEVFALSGAQIQKIDNEGLFGYFGGMYIEKRFDDRDLSIIAEAQYLYFNSDIIQFTRSLSGVNYSFGFKYYFTK
jgi:hypothetical protein